MKSTSLYKAGRSKSLRPISQIATTSSASLQFPHPTSTPRSSSRGEAMEREVGFLSPARSSCVSSDGFGSPIWASPREGLLDSSPTSCVSDGRGSGGRLSSSTWGWGSPREAQLDSPASCVSDGRGGGYASPDGVSAEKVREAERLLRAISERYDGCFLRLRDATAEVAQHRLERLRLRAENMQLSLILQELETDQGKQAFAVAPPKPVEEVAARAPPPKSISIRSKGYLSQKQLQGETDAQRLRVRAPPVMEEAADGNGEVEVEAYSQGAEKTELCNKWERGSCSYGGRCRFAHGLQDMRPVIRHPRYKTLPCQMFAAASGCPYGHRCHFRHSPSHATASF